MSYTPVTQGEVLAFPCTFLQDDGTPLSIAGAVVTVVFNPVPGAPPQNTRFIGGGTFVATNAGGGLGTYTNAAGDFALSGYWTMTAVATTGGLPRYSDPLQLLIRPAP